MNAYAKISEDKQVQMHPVKGHCAFLDKVRDSTNRQMLDLDKFRDYTLRRSRLAAVRETQTRHIREQLTTGTSKALLELQNNLGGVYTLTADEITQTPEGKLVIRESKNAQGALPSMDDIKDGLFKLVLYSSIEQLYWGDKAVSFTTQLRLTGQVHGSLHLPASEDALVAFCEQNGLSAVHTEHLHWLNTELHLTGLTAVVEGY